MSDDEVEHVQERETNEADYLRASVKMWKRICLVLVIIDALEITALLTSRFWL